MKNKLKIIGDIVFVIGLIAGLSVAILNGRTASLVGMEVVYTLNYLYVILYSIYYVSITIMVASVFWGMAEILDKEDKILEGQQEKMTLLKDHDEKLANLAKVTDRILC